MIVANASFLHSKEHWFFQSGIWKSSCYLKFKSFWLVGLSSRHFSKPTQFYEAQFTCGLQCNWYHVVFPQQQSPLILCWKGEKLISFWAVLGFDLDQCGFISPHNYKTSSRSQILSWRTFLNNHTVKFFKKKFHNTFQLRKGLCISWIRWVWSMDN